MHYFIGLAKTTFNTSVCLLEENNLQSPTIFLTERLQRKKASSDWPILPLAHLRELLPKNSHHTIAENRDVHSPYEYELSLDKRLPFFDLLKKRGLERFSPHFNQEITFVGHHFAHALAAHAFSPFEESLILVFDGAGNKVRDLNRAKLAPGEKTLLPTNLSEHFEEFSLYAQEGGKIRCLKKEFLEFSPSLRGPQKYFSDGAALFYEEIASYVFRSKRATGKIMGLAPFGQSMDIETPQQFLNSLEEGKRFKGKGKKEWEESLHHTLYRDLAATAQMYYEKVLFERLYQIKEDYPHVKNIILTGGTALNCVANQKVRKSQLFNNLYIPSFPGDESISFGSSLAIAPDRSTQWAPVSFQKQSSFWGPKLDTLDINKWKRDHTDLKFQESSHLSEDVAELLLQGEIIAWFQGRSEVGPRALGHRSLLARADLEGLQDDLNSRIKKRESFRPYAASILQEYASTYFQVEESFHSPFMSFTVPVRPSFQKAFQAALHIDNTSRIQTVTKEQASTYYELIKTFGEKSGTYGLLNTSLNIMGEPIVETPEEAINFLRKTPVKYLVIGNTIVTKRKAQEK